MVSSRDHLQKEITQAPDEPKKVNKYLQRTKSDLRKLAIKDVNVVKYIIRFQRLGLEHNSASYCELATVLYLDKWSESKKANQQDADYCDQADIAIDALHETMEYFSELQETMDAEDHGNTYIYNASNDEYVVKSECY